MSDFSEFTHQHSLPDSDPGYRDYEDQIGDMIDGSNCPDGWHQECDPDYPDNCSCEID